MTRRDYVVTGLQTGDEGKGKIDEYCVKQAVKLSGHASNGHMPVLNFRFQGGSNAGHTIVIDSIEYKLHQIPSGILIPRTYNLTGEGCFVNPRALVLEIAQLQRQGVKISQENFGVASNAHVTLDYHVLLDEKNFDREGHTSTGRGIGPTAVDKVGRVGIRFAEFLDRKAFIDALKVRFPNGFGELQAVDAKELPLHYSSVEAFADSYAEARGALTKFSTLQSRVMKTQGTEFRIAEGAQGFRLDVDRGLYPGVTSSNPSMVPLKGATVIGVVKLYESSVGGNRPFVSRIKNPELEHLMRENFGERGTTTGRPRDLGWFDAVAVRHAIDSTETDVLISTCGDRLQYLHEQGKPICIVTGYQVNGKTYHDWDPSFHKRATLYEVQPIVEEFEPWRQFAINGRLTDEAQRYVNRIQELVGREFAMHGTGRSEDDILHVKSWFGR